MRYSARFNTDSTAGRQFRRRRVVALAIAAVSLGLLAVAYWGVPGSAVVSPGEVTTHHAAIANDCAACHRAASGSSAGGVHANLSGETGDLDSLLCLECHDLGRFARNAHSQSPPQLAEITARANASARGSDSNTDFAPVLFQPDIPRTAEGELACRACHVEHQGRQFDLTRMSDAQCQTCHANQFHSFSDGHPEFSGFPYKRRTRLHFDHSTHYGTHFANFERIMPHGAAPASCRSCHQIDQEGKYMLTRGFSESCASCHGGQITGESLPALTFLALPALDLATLRDKGIGIGDWPKPQPASVSTIDELPELMQLLLSSDAKFVEAREKLRGLNLRFLASASEAQLAALEDLVWAVKRLMHDVVQGDKTALKQRLDILKPAASSAEMAELANCPPRQFVVSAQQRWLPNLASEVRAHLSGEDVISTEEQSTTEQSPTAQTFAPRYQGGWFVQDRDSSIRYRAQQHADKLLRSWLDVTARLSEGIGPGGDTEKAGSTTSPFIRRVFASLAKPAASGRCMKCHTAEPNQGGGLEIHWHAWRPVAHDHKFTKFAHDPHLTVVGQQGCTQCHLLQAEITFTHPKFVHRNGTVNLDSSGIETSGFVTSNQQNCAQCHRPGAARDNCLTCHNYHAGRFAPADWSNALGNFGVR